MLCIVWLKLVSTMETRGIVYTLIRVYTVYTVYYNKHVHTVCKWYLTCITVYVFTVRYLTNVYMCVCVFKSVCVSHTVCVCVYYCHIDMCMCDTHTLYHIHLHVWTLTHMCGVCVIHTMCVMCIYLKHTHVCFPTPCLYVI